MSCTDQWKTHPFLHDLANAASTVYTASKLEELIVKIHSMGHSQSILNQEELVIVSKALSSLSAHVRAKCIDVLAKRAGPKLWLRGGCVGDLVVWHTDDGDARVRDRAYDCLRLWCSVNESGDLSNLHTERNNWIHANLNVVHATAIHGLLDIEVVVRCTSLKLLAQLSTRWPDHTLPADASSKSIHSSESLRVKKDLTDNIVDDAFSRICTRLQDPAHQVRQLSMRTLAYLAHHVTDERLLQTLEKTVMTDRKVQQSMTSDGVIQSRTLSTLSILSSGPSGAIISGLEDEFSEVRCVTLATVTHIAPLSTRFASDCQDLLVDMLTDDIQDVRLAAIRALGAVGDQVPLQSEQVAIITSALAEGAGRIRRRLHHLLSRCRLSSAPCLISLLDGLLQNLRRYPQDRDSLWRCAASVGRRHPVFVEACLPSLLRTHSWLSGPEPNWEDTAYLTVLLLVLNAESGAPTMRSKFPRYVAKTRLYLFELVPTLLPKQDRFSSTGSDSNRLTCSTPSKRQRLENCTDSMYPRSTTSSLQLYTASVVKRICSILLEVRMKLSLATEKSDEDQMVLDSSQPCCASHSSIIQQAKLSLLSRLVFTDLAQTAQKLDQYCHMEGLVQWLLCLSTAAWFLLSSFGGVSHSCGAIRNLNKYIFKSLKLILKAKYLFVGKSELENSLISVMCKNLGSLLKEPSDSVIQRNLLADTFRCLNAIFESLFDPSNSQSKGSEHRLSQIRLILLQPSSNSLLSSLASKSLADESEDNTNDSTWFTAARNERRNMERMIPEIRFTATIGSVSIRIRALVIGLDVNTARNHVCVLFCRPDYQLKSFNPTDSNCRSSSVFTWWPPHGCWHSATEDGVNTEFARDNSVLDKIDQLERVELRAHLELSAGQWSDAGTIDLGLGYQVDQIECERILCVPLDGSFILPLMHRKAFEKIKLIPCAPINQW